MLSPRREQITRSDSSSAGSFVDVASVEKAFLEGSFRDALTLANRCLKQQARSYDNVEARPLLTPLLLHFDVAKKKRYIAIHWNAEEPSDTASRAAAIALQSWYELATQDGSSQGNKFLQPFLDTYTSTAPGDVLGRRVMSAELLIVWIRFLCSPAVNQGDEAIALATEVLQQVRSLVSAVTKQSITSEVSRNACRELVTLHFTELLPRQAKSVCTEDVVRHLAGISTTPPRATLSSKQSALGSTPDLKNVVQQILCFCNTDDGNWPDWLHETFQECRIVLQAMLRQVYHQSREHDKEAPCGAKNLAEQFTESSSYRLSASQRLTLRQIRSWKDANTAVRWIIKEHLLRLRFQLVRYSSGDDYVDRKQQIQVIVVVLCLTYCWRRHRQRISRIGQNALATALWKPAREILDALGLPRGNKRN